MQARRVLFEAGKKYDAYYVQLQNTLSTVNQLELFIRFTQETPALFEKLFKEYELACEELNTRLHQGLFDNSNGEAYVNNTFTRLTYVHADGSSRLVKYDVRHTEILPQFTHFATGIFHAYHDEVLANQQHKALLRMQNEKIGWVLHFYFLILESVKIYYFRN